MVAHESGDKIGCAVPAGLARHFVVDGAPVDFQSFKGDILHPALFVVSVYDRHVRLCTIVADVAEGHVLHPPARGCTILLIVADLHMKEATLMNLLDADIVEKHILHIVVVATIDGHASLVIHLRFALAKDVDVFINKPHDAVLHFGIAMYANEDGVSHVCPQGRVGHAHIMDRTVEPLAGGVCSSAIVGSAAEYPIVKHIA